MKKLGILLMFLACAILCTTLVLSAAPKAQTASLNVTPAKLEGNEPISTAPEAQKVIEARFLNMLNHSFVYDSCFDTVGDIVNCSVAALLDHRTEDEDFIPESIIADYVYNMFGVEIEDFSAINADFPKYEGYVYVLPRGYSVYSHEMVSCVMNEDGSFSVTTNVKISTHDNGEYIDTCTTLFVANPESQFGYNIVYSNIGGVSSAA